MKIIIAVALLGWILCFICHANAREIGFIEDFSLAADRFEALKHLIPGSSEYYYYSCLHAQNTGNFKQVHDMLEQWIKRDGYTQQVKEIMNRQALLEYEQDPEKSLEYIRRELNLRFDHEKETATRKTDYPTTLDQDIISIASLTQLAFSHYQNLQGIEDAGLDILQHDQLDPDRRRDLLQRLKRPDIPNLAKLVTEDLKYKYSGGFGSIPIHSQLLKSQMDDCLKLMPELRANTNFIMAYLTKLAPADDVDIRYNLLEKKAYLERMWDFVKDLEPAHNSLKTHILWHILDMNRTQGNYDDKLFMTYIKLPRNVYYIHPDYVNRREFQNVKANLNADFSNITRLPSVGTDEELVKAYLSYYFVAAKNYKDYDKFIADTYLKDIFVETKIVNGIGDMEQWYSLMDPGRYQGLKDRVDLEFAVTNKKFFGISEPVALDLYIKNIDTLLVKIFELNTFNYYQANLEEVATDVNLDGLVATREKVIHYDDPPLRRIRRTFDFPEMNRPGVFVAEFIGNGKSSRAVIRKGKLYAVESIGAAGHEFMIQNDQNQLRPHAAIWLSGHEYKPDEHGIIIIPFTNNPGNQTIILKDNDFSALAQFEHLSENYALSVGFYADRESLLKGFSSKVIVRPTLTLNSHPVSLSLLENVRLIIESVDHDGVSTSKEVSDFEIFEDKDAVFEFKVPENLSRISFTLKAQIQNMSRSKKEDLADRADFSLNQIDVTPSVEDIFLSHADGKYMIALLGKNGEPKPDRAVKTELKHRYFRDTIHVLLQTSEKGQIQLGSLEGISWIKATGPEGASHKWDLSKDLYHHAANIHSDTGSVIQIPVSHSALSTQHSALQYSLLETRAQTYVTDYSDKAEMKNGFMEIAGLPAGDYALFLKPLISAKETKINLRLTDGKADHDEHDVVVSENRILETRNPHPLQIRSIDVGKSSVQVHMENSSTFTRVHVFATCFMPDYHPFFSLNHPGLPEPYEIRLTRPESQYIEGRNIGDEYRYILDRKYAEKFPGNMLNRPELLLNPWSIRDTETGTDMAAAGEAFASERPAQDRRKKAHAAKRDMRQIADSFSNLDFLGETAVLLLNLKPDEHGVITIDRKAIGNSRQLHMIAADPINTVYREISLPETEMKKRNLRLIQGLDAEKHFTEQKQISLIRTGENFHLTDITTSEFEIYDSLDKIYRLLVTLSSNSTLQEFSFILRWQDMDEAEKKEKYSKYACHELNFFIYQKDRKFFDRVILPYLKNKKDKTFFDHWLTGDDLTDYLKPWAFSQLNIVEKILLAQRNQKSDFSKKSDFSPSQQPTANSQQPTDENQKSDFSKKSDFYKYIKDLFDMIPPDIDTYNRLFDIALKGRSLEEDGFGFGAAKDRAMDEFLLRDAEAPMPAPMMAAMPEPELAMELDLAESESLKEMKARPDRRERRLSKGMMRTVEGWASDDDKGGYFSPPRKKEREAARQFFQKLDNTKEWVENNYYHLPIEQQDDKLITVNAFWNDFAKHISQQPTANSQQPFFSKNFMYATRNFAEMMLALSVIDLPFKAQKHESVTQGILFSVKAGSPMIVFHKEIKPAMPVEEKIPILVSQHFFNPNDRYRYADNEQFDKYIEDEFLVHTAYGCQFVLSNPTSSRHKLSLLLQIPRGAMPISNGFYTRSIPITLEPYAVQKFEYQFYFPESGKFQHYPVQVAKNEQFVAGAAGSELNVVASLSKTDTASWDYISQNGTDQEVLNFLNSCNLNRVNLSKIAFRMRDKGFFKTMIALLQQHYVYHHTLWEYSIYHNEPDLIAEFLKHSDYANWCGDYIATRLLFIDPVERKTYQHMEYKPLVNARAHQLGRSRKILNDRFYDQYHRFMKFLSYRQSLMTDDLMAVTYYLLLQDRVSEAMGFFKQIDPDHIRQPSTLTERSRSQIQYDYLQAYLDFYTENTERAERIAAKYADYPVVRWQNLFASVTNQLNELKGGHPEITDKEDQKQVHTQLASTEASFEFSIESRKITINYQNLESCRVNYYPMDIELLFSRNPFVRQQTDHFAFIQPNESTEISLPKDQSGLTFDLPEKFHNANVMVEIIAKGMKKSQAYYANSLDIQVIENYGEIKVAHEALICKKGRNPLSKVYVKVYCRMKDGNIQFYKDGYTDLRGRFDYVSLNTNELDYVERFAILIMSDAYGAVIREAAPPKR